VRSLAAGGVTNAAVVVLDHRDCSVLAMVGSADYWNRHSGSVNGALARRQPGSTLKPFTYALAFERGYSPASVVADVETRYGEVAGELFVPKNYSEEFAGPVLMGEALGRSLNVPAVRVANLLGPGDLLSRLRQVGFESLDQPAAHYGLGLTLGNGEVTLLELAEGYAMFARGGRTCRARALADEPPSEGRQAYSEQVSALVTDVLSDQALRARAFGPANALMLGFPVAVKTGTSTNWRDNWAIGYAGSVTVAVWSGDFEGRSLNHLAGVTGAGPLFHKVMKLAVRRDGRADPVPAAPPEGTVEIAVCALSGKRATPRCAERRTVRLLEKSVPAEECPWHVAQAVDKRNGLLAGPKCPSQFVERKVFEALPPTYAQWQADHARAVPPTRYSPLCPASGVVPGALVVTYPRRGEVFVVEPGYERSTQSLQLTAEVDPPLPQVTWLIDGKAVAAAGWPYQANWKLERGAHRIELAAGGKRSDPVQYVVR
jgi:penicillin-binding protein 1C